MRAFPGQLQIDIRRRDIIFGERGSACYCPAALAARRALGRRGLQKLRMQLLLGGLRVFAGDSRWPLAGYDIPGELQQWMLNFDSELRCSPASFILTKKKD